MASLSLLELQNVKANERAFADNLQTSQNGN
jgi:hypothetical protein